MLADAEFVWVVFFTVLAVSFIINRQRRRRLTCSRCGLHNVRQARFCARCGRRLG